MKLKKFAPMPPLEADSTLPCSGTQHPSAADTDSGHGPILVTASAFLLLLAVVSADVKLGTRFGVLLFYLVPIAWTAWFAGRNLSLFVAVCCAFARFGVEIVEEYNTGTSRPELVWSIGSELLFFLIFTGLLVKLQSQLTLERSMARSDGLTRLLNAHSFESAVAVERERLRRYGHTPSLIYFDLDNFKAVNDEWGHATGDEVLQMIARIVSANTRQIDAAARMGGDEFAVLLPETDIAGAKIVLERLQRKILAAMEGNEWPVTVSFGCVTFQADTQSVSAMLYAADSAMYQAKKAGKNRVCQMIFSGESA